MGGRFYQYYMMPLLDTNDIRSAQEINIVIKWSRKYGGVLTPDSTNAWIKTNY
jgi:hypothetical protein